MQKAKRKTTHFKTKKTCFNSSNLIFFAGGTTKQSLIVRLQFEPNEQKTFFASASKLPDFVSFYVCV